MFFLNQYNNEKTFNQIIDSKPVCINYTITLDGAKKLELISDNDKKYVKPDSIYFDTGSFCQDLYIYNEFLKLIKYSYIDYEKLNNINIKTFIIFDTPEAKNGPINDYKSHSIGEDWISFCQQVDS
jgi:hypothetical protein